MHKEDLLPSESEWKIMEELWRSDIPLTTLEIQKKMPKENTMTLKMVRTLTNRLLQKGLVGFEVDERDSRVYHYHALKSQKECTKEKSRQFVDNYFAGNQTGAFSALLQSCKLTEEQITELEDLLKQSKEKAQ